VIRQVAEQRLGCRGIVGQVDTADADVARAERQGAGEHLHDRGLAGAVLAEQSQHFAALQFDGDVPDGAAPAEIAAEVIGAESGLGHDPAAIKNTEYSLIWSAKYRTSGKNPSLPRFS